jgi:broad specificity phosphatase PhoE
MIQEREKEHMQQMTAEQRAQHIAQLLKQAQLECRADIERIDDPKAQALFETIAEVLGGAMKALSDYQNKNEGAWRSYPQQSARPQHPETTAEPQHPAHQRPQPPVVTDMAVDISENEPPPKLFTE